jgi:mono/diheme cytochrome c family protein
MSWRTIAGMIIWAGLAARVAPGAATSTPLVTFEGDVRPILKAHCFQCHGEDGTKKGELDLRLTRLMVKGGKSGAAVVPGDVSGSLLCKKVSAGEMPKGKGKLSDKEIATIAAWVAGGARTVRPEPQEVPAVWITESERNFWSFRPIGNPEAPKVGGISGAGNAIDAFLLEKLAEKGLGFSKEADRATLIRRAYFDLVGLPPPPSEVKRFEEDRSEDAYEKLIDRLLASPQYGERWGRYWLDVAGYAESDGYNETDRPRAFAWKYRDYVIRSYNADKPFDEFIREQLAGDEMVRRPYVDLSQEDQEKLIATGFLRMAPDGTGSANANPKLAQNEAVAGVIKTVSTSLLGLTVGCAQCHDHRYDPIPQIDYYRLRAVFDPAFDMEHWRTPSQRLISVLPPDKRKLASEIEAKAAAEERKIAEKERAALEKVFERELAKVPEEQREAVRAARNTPMGKRTAEQVALLRVYPSADVFRQLDLYDPPTYKALQKEREAVAQIRATKPAEDAIDVLTEVPGQVPVSRLYYRGDVEQPGQTVTPGELTVLASWRKVEIPEKNDYLPTTGRRLAYARSLTDGTHPLVARVIVNQVWLHHFGAGIVATPGDFGALGEKPTHPELLDYLAREFMSGGWKLKRLHKAIMMSAAYRQASARRPELEAVDPENRLLGRFNLRRLDAEAVRDSILAASGSLNERLFGASTPVGEDRDGKIIVGKQKRNVNGEAVGVDAVNADAFRRSIYIQVRRSQPLAMLEAFDMPVMNPNCDIRRASTVAPQSLLLMNDRFVLDQSEAMARMLMRDEPDDVVGQVREGWELMFGREAGGAEVGAALDFLAGQTRELRERASAKVVAPAAKGKNAEAAPPVVEPEVRALASWCQALMSSNRFLYVE